MAIRFHCQRCHQLLGIATRKAGAQIECPQCGWPQTVPSEKTAAVATSTTGSAQAPEVLPVASQVAVCDPEPVGMGAPSRDSPSQPLPIPPPVSALEAPAVREAARPMPPGTILFRRRTIYVQGLLFLLLAGGAFAGGYFVGRGHAQSASQVARQQAPKQSVLVEGKLYYDTGAGKIAADAGAVIVVLPAGKLPEATLSIQGLRPRDPPPAPDSESLRMLEDFGGVYGRSDESGAFTMVLPAEGRYRVLLVSRQTTRAEDVDLDELDLSQITQYFYRAADLIGPYKYRWTLKEFTVGHAAIEHNFGRDGEE